MLKLFFTFFLFVFEVSLYGQIVKETPPPKPMTKKQERIEERNHNCIHRNKYNSSKRLTFYPFNKNSKIQFVSFDVKPDTSNKMDTIIKNSLPIENDTICYKKLDEIITLTKPQIDSLTDILYNVGLKGPITIGYSSLCYIPRNAILFLDSAGRTFEYIEICFECDDHKLSSENIDLGIFCDQKYNLLKKLFISSGIQIGTLKGKNFIAQ